MSLFDNKEDARIEKAGGEIVGPYKALFAGGTIVITDPKADVEEGDAILRKLPNGKDERSIVTSARAGAISAAHCAVFLPGHTMPDYRRTWHPGGTFSSRSTRCEGAVARF